MRLGIRIAALASSLLLTACGGGRGTEARTTLRVFAATSLRAAFTELERSFEAEHDGIDVEVTYGGSSGLAAQIEQGAPAHVLATADEHTMRTVTDESAPRRLDVVARNRLAIVVEPGNPEGVGSLRDLSRTDLVVVLCAPRVPCGRLAAAALARAGVVVEARSFEEHVGGVRSKVELGEADAGIVYVTDAIDAGSGVTTVDDRHFDDRSLEAVYPIAILEGAPRDPADAWVDHVRSDTGRSALTRAGFLAP